MFLILYIDKTLKTNLITWFKNLNSNCWNLQKIIVFHDLTFQIFVQSNQGDEETTVVNYLGIIGSPVDTTNMEDFKRVRCFLRLTQIRIMIMNPFPTSPCKFSFLIATHYLLQRRGEFRNLPTKFMFSDHILYSHGFSD